jgi:HPt (histidine-containing phosphotransfer) domain-containing protein
MQLNGKSMESTIGSEFSGAWILPAALRQLEECGEAVLVEELIDIFQTDTAERLELLRHAAATADLGVVRTEAHTIKGSALQVGALRVADACLQLEMEARKPLPGDLAPLFRALLERFDEVRGVFAARGGSAIDGPPHYGQ